MRKSASTEQLPSVEEMQGFDAQAIARGTSASTLMERAGEGIAERIRQLCSDKNSLIVLLCGPGNNGGDGLVLARSLRLSGFHVEVVLICSGKVSSECGLQLRKISGFKVFGHTPEGLGDDSHAKIDGDELATLLTNANIVVDSILGVGQSGEPRGEIAQVLEIVTTVAPSRLFAIDIPTGVNANTGEVSKNCLAVNRTFAIECIKRGLTQYPARGICGEISVVPIGIDISSTCRFQIFGVDKVRGMLGRPLHIHKGQLGRVLVVGGSLRMPGAGMLAALGALRAGSGIVSRVARRSWTFTLDLPECMLEVLEGEGDQLHEGDVAVLADMSTRFDSVVIGPGMGCSEQTALLLDNLIPTLKNLPGCVVYDADALNALAYHRSGIDLGHNAVITPHPGEAGRLLGMSVEDVQADRFSAVIALAEKYKCVALLKGAGTLVSDSTYGYVVMAGSPILATPGSGDVLAGVIGALGSQQVSKLDASCMGAWLHGWAGEELVRSGRRTALASEIASGIACYTE